MRPIKTLLFLCLCTLSFWTLLYSQTTTINPSKEKNSVGDIRYSIKIPKIALDSIHYQGSLFDAYLDSHKISFSFDDQPLSWNKKIPKAKNTVNYHTFFCEVSSSGPKKEGLKTPKQESASLHYFNEDDFLHDLVDSLKRQSEYYHIRALFHPEHAIPETDTLETYLSNSIEFKVLSKTSRIKKKIDKALNEHEKPLLTLTKSLFTKQNIKTVAVQELNLPNNSVSSVELNTSFKLPENSLVVQNSLVLDCNKTHLPLFVETRSNKYYYHPGLYSPSQSLADAAIVYSNKKITHFDSKGSCYNIDKGYKSVTLALDDANHHSNPLQNASCASYLKSINPKTIKKNNFAQSFQALSEEFTKESFNVSPAKSFINEKTDILVLDYDPSFPDTNIKIRQLSKRDFSNKEASPKDESIKAENVILAIETKDPSKEYHFQTKNLKKIAFEQPKQNKSPPPKNNLMLASIEMNEIDNSYLLLPSHHETIASSKKPSEYSAQNEERKASQEISLSFLTYKNLNKSYYLAPVPDNFHESFIYQTNKLGRLVSHDLFKQGSDNISSLKIRGYDPESTLLISQKSESKHGAQEDYSLSYYNILDHHIHSNILFKDHPLFHRLKANITTVDLKDELNTETKIIVTDTQINLIANAVDVPLDELDLDLDDEIEILNYEAYNLPDLSTSHLCKVKLKKASFETSVNLPKLSEINKKKSFFLNPMLSLMGEGLYPMATQLLDRAQKANKALRMVGYNLFNWPTLDELKTDSYPDSFSLDTRLFSSSEDVYDFVCTLKTDERDVFAPLPLHALYILDTSSSIEAHRFKVFKKAIITSLNYLDEDSKFNIAILDKDGYKLLHEKSVSPTEGAISFVKRRLQKIEQSSKTSFDSLITLLKKQKSLAFNEITHRCCLLLSDGNLAKNIRIDQKSLESLTSLDAGNFSVYTASVSDKNNNAMLSLLAKTNHGFSLYTKTHSSFARKFATMLRHIKRPLLHDIHISFPDNKEQNVYFNERISPILLADKSFTFYGNTDTKSKARIFIQGRSGERWVNILKELPLKEARKARYSLRKKLESQKTLLSLYSFLKTKDEKYLVEAKNTSKEFDIPLPIP
ncbi:MAG: hypothetical protein S4CHLAM20_06030 [Chlamydiia bacterium]|nr:hypothetical protein [Chlamydiia bacterium]